MVATVISSEAPVVFLDEPTTGLDYLSRKELWQPLSEMKKDRLIILTTHYLEEAEILGYFRTSSTINLKLFELHAVLAKIEVGNWRTHVRDGKGLEETRTSY